MINKSNNKNTSLSLQSCLGETRFVEVGNLGRFAKVKQHYAKDYLNERELLGKVGAFFHNDKFAPDLQSLCPHYWSLFSLQYRVHFELDSETLFIPIKDNIYTLSKVPYE